MPGAPRPIAFFAKPKPARRPRGLVTHDGTMIVKGESYPIVGAPIALDARPGTDFRSVTFDGATPLADKEPR